MKAVFLRLGALSLACAPLIAPSAASAQATGGGYDNVPEIVDACIPDDKTDTRRPYGNCVASYIASAPALDTFVCRYWERNGMLEYFGFSTVGECVESGIAAP